MLLSQEHTDHINRPFQEGARIPKESAPDSWNRLSTLLGDDETDRPWIMEYSSNHVLSVRSGKWKYIDPSDGPAMIPWGLKINIPREHEES